MIRKIILARRQNHCVLFFMLLLMISLIVRLPYFFEDFFAPDEGIFILIGQALADGHLPYTLILDNKPPLGFAFFALVLSLVPDSLSFVRFAGSIMVGISAFFVYRIALRFMLTEHAFFAATLFILSASLLINSGPLVMMEHIALVPVLAALLMLLDPGANSWRYFLIGLLLGISVLIRTNLAYLLVAIVVAVSTLPPAKGWKRGIASALLVASGSGMVFAGVLLVYAVNGQARLLINAAILVPMAYAESGLGIADMVLAMIFAAVRYELPMTFDSIQQVLTFVLWMMGLVGFWVVGIFGIIWLFLSEFRKTRSAILIGVFIFALCFGIVSSAHPWGHYLIQIAPFVALGAGYTVSLSRQRNISIVLVIMIIFGATLASLPHYHRLITDSLAGKQLYKGPSFQLADYLKSTQQPGDTLFMASEDILVYWLMDTHPVTPVAGFPYLLVRAEKLLRPIYGPGVTTESLLEDIFAQQPTRIILREKTLQKDFHDIQILHNEIEEHYQLEQIVADRFIYRRKE